jgi:hypothetical protein
MDLDADADPEICLTARRVARRPRMCHTCGSQITPGQAYDRHFFPEDRATYTVHADQAVCWVELNEGETA